MFGLSTAQWAAAAAVVPGAFNSNTLTVNNNGNVTFNARLATYTPFNLTGATGNPIIAPFFADVDTRGTASLEVTYGGGELRYRLQLRPDPVGNRRRERNGGVVGVPEPGTLALLGTGLVGLVGYRRTKRMK